MKQVGVLTFHRASNYGAVLQAYALQTVFEKLGCEVEIIDYRCPGVENAHNPMRFILTHGIRSVFRLPGKVMKSRKFNHFRNTNLHLSQKATIENISEIESQYSVLVAGSDQVWNDKLSGVDEQFFFPYSSNSMKYTYAISIGDRYEKDILRSNIQKYGLSLKVVSLREDQALPVLESMTDTPCRVDLDPTMLLSQDDWEKLAKKPDYSNSYILLYTVPGPNDLIVEAKELSRRTGYDIIYLNSSYSQNRDIRKKRYVSPEEFVGWFLNAEYVCTNSFHGVAFSVVMNKPFITETSSTRGTNTRVSDLLGKFGLDNCSLSKAHNPDTFPLIQWDRTNTLLELYRNDSLKYLKQMIEEKEQG